MAQGEVRFDNRVILVTGSGRGIGRAHALLLTSRGANVVVADNGSDMDGDDPSSEPANSVVDEITARQGKAVAYTRDLGTEEGSIGAVEMCLKTYGRIDGIIHNASTVPNLVSVEKLSTHDMDMVMRSNCYAALWLSRAAWPHMVKQKFGRIAYTTSGAIYGADGNGPYSAAKAGNIGLMRCLASEGAKHNILVNIYSPSALTRMTDFPPGPFKEWHAKTHQPEKVAVGVAVLMSEDCKANGEVFAIGAGRMARIALAETEGYFGPAASIEEMRDAMPGVLADTKYFHAKDLTERMARVTKLFGFEGGSLKANDGFAVAVRETKQR